MKSYLSHEQIEDLLDYIGVSSVKDWKGDKIQFCCPIHGESHPSCGINADFSPPEHPEEHYQVFHCFSCGASGTLVWFLYKSLPDKFKSVSDAASFIRDRYKVSYTYTLEQVKSKIKRYSDIFSSKSATRRFELPMYELAPFKSGKETFQYFFDRGFTVEELKEYMIGRDLKSRTITFPIFWEDGKLAGIIGRYIDRNRPKNSRFKIYDFPKGSLIYPLDKVVPVDGTLICVESIMDCIALRSWGFPNAISTMGDGMSSLQANQISSRCSRLIALFDHDEGGRVATSITEKRLKNKVVVLKPTYYPDFGKDPLEWGELETLKVIRSAKIINSRSIPRL